MSGPARSDMLRTGLPQAPNMLSGPPFIQNLPQSGQQQIGPNHPGIPPNPNAGNAGMMLGNSPHTMTPQQQQQRFMQQMHDREERQARQMPLRQGQGGHSLIGPSGASVPGGIGAPHLGGMVRNPAVGFNANMIQQPQVAGVRRVTSQSQLGQGSGQLGGMSPNVVNSSMGMGMTQGSMNGMHPGLRMQQQPQQPMQGQMSPEMSMGMNRPGGNPGMAPGRTGSAQPRVMDSLSQPPSHSHPLGPRQNQFQNSQHQPPQKVSSPRPSSHHSQTHTPSMSMATPGPSRTPVNNRPQMPPGDGSLSFMDFPNSQFPQGHGNPRAQNGYSFVPTSSTPPAPMPDMPQTMPTRMNTPGGTHIGFPLTPAQQFEQMNTPSESHANPFPMGPPHHVPPRPPSQHNLHPLPQQQQLSQHQQSHPSPPRSDLHMSSLPQRPQSQPQSLPRPPSQQPRSPRAPHSQLPPGAPPPPPGSRIAPQMQTPGPGPHMTIAPRPPQLPALSGPSASSTQPPEDASPPSIPRSAPNGPALPLGSGQGLMRLLQFSGVLASESKTKLQLSWWNELVKEYFTPKAVMKFTLWKDNQRNEAKPFEIGVPILPRFFLVTTQSGVKSMTLSLDGARERMFAQGHSIVECVGAVWTYKYNNGYTVTLRGPLTARIVVTSPHPPGSTQAAQGSQFLLKFEEFQFDANYHDKYISLDSIIGTRTLESPKMPAIRNAPTPTLNGTTNQQQQQLEEDKKWEEPRVTIDRASLPGEPVNAFGIPQATMRCLELAESVSQMTDLISFSTGLELGPLDALKQFAMKLRESQPFPPLPSHLPNGVNHMMFNSMYGNTMMSTPPVTLYSSAPPSVTNPPPNLPSAPSMNSPKNAPPSASNSPQKQHKTIPQQSQASSSSTVPTASPSMSSSAIPGNNVPSKRKQASETSSPTTATPELPPKRTRKRRQTGAG